MKNNSMLRSTLLSAALFSIPFFSPENFGWAMLFFPVPLYWVFKNKHYSLQSFFVQGTIWGVVVFSLHFMWLAWVLLFYSQIHWLYALLLYALGVGYFAVTSGIWFMLTSWLSRSLPTLVALLVTTIGYFYWIEKYSVWFLSEIKGYPFASPLIPLLSLIKQLFLIFSFLGITQTSVIENSIELVSSGVEITATNKRSILVPLVLPSEWGVMTLEKNIKPSYAAQTLYHALSSLPLKQLSKEYDNIIIVAPESAFPFALNKSKETLELLHCCLPDNAHFLLGGLRKQGNKSLQSIYWLHQEKIMDYYDKMHLIDFTEKAPAHNKYMPQLSRLFKVAGGGLAAGTKQKVFTIAPGLVIQPIICSELYFTDDWKHGNLASDVLLIFANDSWYMPYFQTILKMKVEMSSWWYDKRVVYASYSTINH